MSTAVTDTQSRLVVAPVRALVAVSEAILRAERVALIGLMGLISLLILTNVATRYTGFPIYWIDESAIFAVVWLCFIGGSAMTRQRMDFAVTLLTERFGPALARAFRIFATLVVLVFGVILGVLCWIWMDPVGITQAGFDAREYAARTFNFLYTERTQTLNWPSWIVYLVLPLFSVTLTLHSCANLAEDLALIAPVRADDSSAVAVEG